MNAALEVTHAYLALGEALKNVLEAHDRAVHERDEALSALSQLQDTDRASRELDDMNRGQILADFQKGFPLHTETTDLEGFQVGDLVHAPGCDGRVSTIVEIHDSGVQLSTHEQYHRAAQATLHRKTVRAGDSVRLQRIRSFSGRVKTIQHNEIGIAHAWFEGDFSVRLEECIAVDPSMVKQ